MSGYLFFDDLRSIGFDQAAPSLIVFADDEIGIAISGGGAMLIKPKPKSVNRACYSYVAGGCIASE